MIASRWLRNVVVICLATTTAGCAGFASLKRGGQKQAASESTSEREKRTKDAIAQYEAGRNRAQYEAALARWQQGDAAGARQALLQLLERSSQNDDARLLLAEVLMFDNQHAEAERHVRQVLERKSDRADAQHLLALLLDAQGGQREALACYEAASRLEPQNQEYRLSLHAARDQAMVVDRVPTGPTSQNGTARRGSVAPATPAR